MGTLEWVDTELSASLPRLIAQGEGQTLEFIRAFPEQARELAKEVAAFATSGAGTILLGVANDGTVVGLPDGDSPLARDALIRRLEGICHGTIKPSLTPGLRFAKVSDLVVLAISLSGCPDPIYYVAGVPHIRHLTQSRPAEPNEVLDRIRAWLSSTTPAEGFADSLADCVADVILYGEELVIDDDSLRWKEAVGAFHIQADFLRRIAAADYPVATGARAQLQFLANSLDEAADLPMAMGQSRWLAFKQLVSVSMDQATNAWTQWVGPLRLRTEWIEAARQAATRILLHLQDLDGRADRLLDAGRTADFFGELATHAADLNKLTYFGLKDLPQEQLASLRTLCRTLHRQDSLPLSFGSRLQLLPTIHRTIADIAHLLRATNTIVAS